MPEKGGWSDNKVCKVQPNSFKASTQELEEIPKLKNYGKKVEEITQAILIVPPWC